MTSQKRLASLSSEETYFDDPSDDEVDVSTICKTLFQISQGLEPNKYYHVSCIEQIFPDLAALIERGDLRMDGGVTQMTSASWQISRFHNAIEDWFRYKGRSFDAKTYDRFERKYAKWDRKSSTAEINHQLEAHGGSSRNCEKCGSIPDEPLRKDYFPEEPQSCLLREVLASVIGVQHLDGVLVDGNSNLRRIKKIWRS
ncbi:hypothetical protein RU639_013750 [Aspergillus parasiticus]